MLDFLPANLNEEETRRSSRRSQRKNRIDSDSKICSAATSSIKSKSPCSNDSQLSSPEPTHNGRSSSNKRFRKSNSSVQVAKAAENTNINIQSVAMTSFINMQEDKDDLSEKRLHELFEMAKHGKFKFF